jgi:hypothetical protein
MRKLLALFGLLIFFGMAARAQEIPVQEAPKPEATKPSKKKKKPEVPTPKFEFDAGYTYRLYKAPSGPKFGMSGWNATLDYNRYRWISLVGELTGTYRSENTQGYDSIYSGMAGPRVYFLGHRHRLTPYGQFTIGYGALILSLPLAGGFPATTRTTSAYAYAGAAGIEYRYKKHWSLRVLEFDYEKTHFDDILFKTGAPPESNYRLSAGIVYRWGERKNKSK